MAPIVTSLATLINQFGIAAVTSAPSGGGGYAGASGGVISDYLDPGPGIRYRAHIFTSSGTFTVTDPAITTIDALLVGGGGGGGYYGGGGGGGAVIHVQSKPQTVGTYPVVVASGGVGALSLRPGPATPVTPANEGGTTSAFGYNATGGGGAGSYNNIPATGGANGGGHGAYLGPPGYPAGVLGTAPTVPAPLTPYATVYAGNRGGTFGSDGPPWGDYPSGGGAGAGGNGGSVPRGSVGGAGGSGVTINIIPSPPSVNSGNGYIWGGGGGGSIYDPPAGTGGAGGPGGGGAGADSATGGTGGINLGSSTSTDGSGGAGGESTGGGGGGSSWTPLPGANGGSGIVVVRYTLPASTGTAKATGGAISFYGGKTIHTFTASGTFATAPNWTAATVEYVVIGGGGSGGLKQYVSGGGGAGAYRTGTTPIGAHPVSTTIQVGAGGVVAELGPTSTPASADGTPSYFGTPITAPGGGGGGTYLPADPGGIGRAGGSGGGGGAAISPGGGGPAPGATPFPGVIGATPPTSWWGHSGGNGGTVSPVYGAGGGGGAGGVGGNGSPIAAGVGGAGIQLPSTFRNPVSGVGAPGPTSAPTPNGFDTSGKYWVAGGGAGSTYPTGTTPGSGGGPGGPYAGGGAGGAGNNGGNGGVNTGGGGGGQEREPGPVTQVGRGGSGIVLIAYPT